MSTAFELDQSGWQKRVADARLTDFDANTEEDASAGEGIFSGAGQGLLRGFARGAEAVGVTAGGTLGQGMDVAGAAGDTLDALTFDEQGNQTSALSPVGTKYRDAMFEATDDIAGDAVDFWTPSSREVGVIGRTLGGFAEIVGPLLVGGGNPSLLIGTSGIEGAKEKIDEGVDATTAIASGEVDALATAIGFKLPFLGKTLAGKMATGAGGNVLVGAGTAELQHELLAGRGYEELAQNYDPLDMQSRAIDVLTGMAFGGIDWASVRSSDRAAVAAANNAKHFQQDTAPGIPQDFAATQAHTKAMDQAFEQMIRGEPVSVDPAVMEANFKARPERVAEVPEELRDFDANRAAAAEFEVRPVERQVTGDEAVRNPIDFDASPEVKLQQLKALTAENVPVVQKIVGDLNDVLPGTSSKMSIKEDAKILEKAKRPDVLAKKPWHGVEHIRDALRFKTVVDSVADLPKVVEVLKKNGVRVEKIDTAKALTPGPWGWRIVALDLVLKNGQLVEHYMPIKELEGAKKADGHKLFEKWRNEEVSKLTAERQQEYFADLKKSRALYQAAWDTGLARAGLDESAVRASLKSFEDSASSLTSGQSAKAPSVRPSVDPQVPLKRTAENGAARTSTSSSGDLKTVAFMGDSSTGIIRSGSFESPVITALKEQLKQQDVMVPTGAIDAEGNAVVRSGREVLAEAEAGIAKAEKESVMFEAAVTCFLTRGVDAP